jgi:hypothetical protein
MIEMFSLTSGIPRYYTQLLSSGDTFIEHPRKFLDRSKAEESNSKKNYKAVPTNATIREEHIKCGRFTCAYCPHGPYYYAYWNDANGNLKKKYIGTKFDPSWKSKTKAKKELRDERITQMEKNDREYLENYYSVNNR